MEPHETEKFLHSKRNRQQSKQAAHRMGRNLQLFFKWGLISRLYKELQKLNAEEIKMTINKWTNKMNRQFLKEETQWPRWFKSVSLCKHSWNQLVDIDRWPFRGVTSFRRAGSFDQHALCILKCYHVQNSSSDIVLPSRACSEQISQGNDHNVHSQTLPSMLHHIHSCCLFGS